MSVLTQLSGAAAVLFERRNKRKASETLSAFEVYRKQIRNELSGKPVDFDALDDALDALGKTPADFAADAKIQAERDEKAKLVADVPKLEAQAAKAEQRKNALIAERNEKLATLNAAIAFEYEAGKDIASKLEEARAAKQWLADNIINPDLVQRIKDGRAAMVAIGKQILEIQDEHIRYAALVRTSQAAVMSELRTNRPEDADDLIDGEISDRDWRDMRLSLRKEIDSARQRKSEFERLDEKMQSLRQEQAKAIAELRTIEAEVTIP